MLRKLLILLCIISATNTLAQQKSTPPSKTTEKKELDYKELGSPMPKMKVLLYKDTTAKKDTIIVETKHISKRKKHEEEAKKDISPYLTNEDVDNGANLIVMMFNPTCSHCQDETALLKKNVSLFNKTQLVLIANPGMAQYLRDFVNMLKVMDYPMMHVGIDSSGFINNAFGYHMLPQINIYDRDRKLLKTYNGETPIDSLKNYIE